MVTEMQGYPQTDLLATLLHLARRAREAQDAAELRFIITNETHALSPYRQAALLMNGTISTLSGVVMPEANAPYVLWLTRVFRHVQKMPPSGEALNLSAEDLLPDLAEAWGEWLPRHALWLSLGKTPGNALLMARDDPWSEGEVALVAEWAALWGQAWSVRMRQRRIPVLAVPGLGSLFKWGGLAAMALALTMPVPLAVLAQAELVPVNPAVVRAPLEGVVDRVLVVPNQPVHRGDALFEFDRAGIRNKLQVAQRALATLHTEYRQRAQQSLIDPASKAQLAPLQGQIAEKSTEVNYLRQLDERGMAVSPRDGIVLLDDPTEWIGRPVVTGEKIMMVADPRAVEVEAWLMPADAISLPAGSPVRLFLNADPMKPVAARLRYLSHEVVERPDGSYAYRVRAALEDVEHAPRLGLKGVARITGESVTLGYWMVRRPLAALRGWLGV